MPSMAVFFAEAAAVLKASGKLLVSDPKTHQSAAEFAESLRLAGEAGPPRARLRPPSPRAVHPLRGGARQPGHAVRRGRRRGGAHRAAGVHFASLRSPPRTPSTSWTPSVPVRAQGARRLSRLRAALRRLRQVEV
jgi:hypothetical protein